VYVTTVTANNKKNSRVLKSYFITKVMKNLAVKNKSYYYYHYIHLTSFYSGKPG